MPWVISRYCLGEFYWFSGNNTYLNFDEKFDYSHRTVSFWVRVDNFYTSNLYRAVLGNSGGSAVKTYGSFGASVKNINNENLLIMNASGAIIYFFAGQN